ncbi:hypothetical protein Tco_1100000 [Tanacetum coccineum]
MDEDQAGPDPGESSVALVGPDREPMHDEFMANLIWRMHILLDQFINDKATEDEQEKLNVESKVVSMVTVPIYQASSLVPPMSTPVIDLSPPKHAPSTTQAPSLPEHVALYEALEASMERAPRDEFLCEKDKSHKRRRDNQDPPLPPPDFDPNTPSSSSKQQSDLHSEQRVEDIPMLDIVNISNSEDIGFAHILKIKPRPEWLKPIPEEDRPATPEPAWVIPTSRIPDVVNNWANALATTYQAPAENSLLEKTGDMRTFMNWYCQNMGKTEHTQADFEVQAYAVVKPFYPDVVHL